MKIPDSEIHILHRFLRYLVEREKPLILHVLLNIKTVPS